MRFQKQGNRECVLATVAMLKDICIEEVREIALQINEIVLGSDEWSGNPRCCTLLYQHFGLPDLNPPVPIMFSGLTTPPDLKGKGSIHFIMSSKAGTSGHIAPFENGVIYEPNVGPMSWEEFRDFWEEHGYAIASYHVTKL